MKSHKITTCFCVALSAIVTVSAQTLYIPGTVGASTNSNVGIGVASPGSVAYAKLQVHGTVSSSAGPHTAFTTTADSYPLLQFLPWNHDNVSLNFDAYYNGTWRSSHAGTNYSLYKINGLLSLCYASGVAPGNTIAWNYGLVMNSAGNVGIGTTNPTQKLAVNGTIRAKEVIVDTGWSDYVFDDSYQLAPLAEVEAHIRTEKHLPGIPTAAEVAADGISLGDMQAKLLAKVEELTLHLIEQDKRIQKLETENTALRGSSTAP